MCIRDSHFEQSAKLAGFPLPALHEEMAAIMAQLPKAIETVQKSLDPSVPDAMFEAITRAAQRRAEELATCLGN